MVSWRSLGVAVSVGRSPGVNEDSAGVVFVEGVGYAVYVADGVGGLRYGGRAARAVGTVFTRRVPDIARTPENVRHAVEKLAESAGDAEESESLLELVSQLHIDLIAELDGGLGAEPLRPSRRIASLLARLLGIGRREQRETPATTLLYAVAREGENPYIWLGYTGDGFIVAAPCAQAPLPLLPGRYASLLAPTATPLVRQVGDAGECEWVGESEQALTTTCTLEEKVIERGFTETFVNCSRSDHVAMTLAPGLGRGYNGYVVALATDGAELLEEIGTEQLREAAKNAVSAAERVGGLIYGVYRAARCLETIGYTRVTRAYAVLLAGCLACQLASTDPVAASEELERFVEELLREVRSGDDRSVAVLLLYRPQPAQQAREQERQQHPPG